MLALLGGFYLGSVCELDAAECRQNYAQETHEHVVAPLGTDVTTAPATQPDDVLAAWPERWTAPPRRRPLFGRLPAASAPWPWVANPPPPLRRLYLRYAVLQV